MNKEMIIQAYEAAVQAYAQYGIDVEAAVQTLSENEISFHCWQGDDVTGLEAGNGGTSGGILSTGSYLGLPRNGAELRADIDKAMSLIPGKQRINLHASHAELNGEKIDRDQYETRHFRQWIDWAKKRDLAIDFNATFFGHPMAETNLTLSSPDENVRHFWINHCKAVRQIAADIGKELGKTVVNNIWVPDGIKDIPANRLYYRQLLKESLDEILAIEYPSSDIIDAVESKYFGIGVESYTVGSHEFYMGYAAHARANGHENVMVTLDMGHFYHQESVTDKISALLLFNPKLLLHVSRPVNWDSDHVVISSETLFDVMREIKRADAFERVYLATDFFDGSINRINAWVTGIRATQKSVLAALLEPTEQLQTLEAAGDFSNRLALIEEARSLPYAAVWNKYCLDQNVPAGADYIADIKQYEHEVLSTR